MAYSVFLKKTVSCTKTDYFPQRSDLGDTLMKAKDMKTIANISWGAFILTLFPGQTTQIDVFFTDLTIKTHTSWLNALMFMQWL